MITPEMIARINELAQKSRQAPLTEEELAEQAVLRRQYIENIRGQVKNHLDNITVVDHSTECSCGCQRKH